MENININSVTRGQFTPFTRQEGEEKKNHYTMTTIVPN